MVSSLVGEFVGAGTSNLLHETGGDVDIQIFSMPSDCTGKAAIGSCKGEFLGKTQPEPLPRERDPHQTEGNEIYRERTGQDTGPVITVPVLGGKR